MSEHPTDGGFDPELEDAVDRFVQKEGGVAAEHLKQYVANLSFDSDEPAAPIPTVPGYTELKLFARGGQSVVYSAVQESTGREVAIKALPAGWHDPKAQARLEREVHILSRCDHEGICPVIDLVRTGSEIFAVFPLLVGQDLAARIENLVQRRASGESWSRVWNAVGFGRSEAEEEPGPHGVVRLMESVATSVHDIHREGVLHRDLKPANIMLRDDGRAVVLDFGLALELEQEPDANKLTNPGDIVGTPAYMSPEQLRNKRPDVRSDVYSLGVILLELLTLRSPHEGLGQAEVYAELQRGPNMAPRRWNDSVPRDLDAVCLKAMEFDPSRRYATALDLAEDLRRVRHLAPTHARPVSGVQQIVRWVRRNRAATGGLLATLFLTFVLIGTTSSHWGSVDGSLEDAEAFLSLCLSRRAGEPADPAAVATLADLFDEDFGAHELLLACDTPEGRHEVLERINEHWRAPSDPEWFEPIGPRAGVATPRPALRFRLGLEAPAEVGIELMGPLGPIDTAWSLSETAEGRRAELAPDLLLDADVPYAWRITWQGDQASAWIRFHVVAPVQVERIDQLRRTGHAPLDCLVRAATAVQLQLAERALLELEGFPADAATMEQLHAAYLRARAYALLNDERWEEEWKRFEELDDALSR